MLDYFKSPSIGPGINKPTGSLYKLAVFLAKDGISKYEEDAMKIIKEYKE